MDYYTEIRKEAVDFIEEVMDDVRSALENEEDYLIDGSVDDRFWECVIDRSYSLTDAAYVVENSNNVEEDSGLWEGKEPRDAIETQAAFTFGNDVREDVEEIYSEMKSEYDDKYMDVCNELTEAHTDEEDYDPETDARDIAFKHVEEWFYDEYDPEVIVVEDKNERIRMIEEYLAFKKRVSRGGYPCGGSYIDARCGVGFGMENEYDYVELDHEIARAIPDIRGKYTNDVEAYLNALKSS